MVRELIYEPGSLDFPNWEFDLDSDVSSMGDTTYRSLIDSIRETKGCVESKLDIMLFKEVLRKFTGLKQITVRNECSDGLRRFTKVFPSGHQLQAITEGLEHSTIKITDLKGLNLDLSQLHHIPLHRIAATCGELKSLSLHFDGNDGPSRADLDERIRSGAMRTLLTSLTELEYLSLDFPIFSRWHIVRGDLRGIIPPGFRWKNLRDVRLSFLESERTELFEFFKLHRSTLRTVHMHNFSLRTTSCTKLLRQMRETLTLQDLCISQRLFGKPEDPEEEGQNFYLGDENSELASALTTWYFENSPDTLTTALERCDTYTYTILEFYGNSLVANLTSLLG
ncbi:hypothetical protein F5Y04DRAFT_274983 [Hypomontagnella monticulosa]|nr:hypothetical protein F5Y04DRAFT_274983 [Hypomontagnella monticulosa]